MNQAQIEKYEDSLAREYSANGELVAEFLNITPKQLSKSRLKYSRGLRSPAPIEDDNL